MEEKNVKKFSLSTFLLIIALIVIIVMGVFIYKLNKDKNTEIQKSSELQAQVNSLNRTVSDLQGKITSVFETISSNISNESNTNDDSNIINLSESEALTILKSKFDILEEIYFKPFDFFNVTDGGEEIKDFENTILKYGTENLLNEIKNNLPHLIRYENSKYIIYYGGGAPGKYDGFDEFENIKVENETITATLKTKQNEIILEDNNPIWQPTEDKSSEFTIIKRGEEWLIDKFNSSDFD